MRAFWSVKEAGEGGGQNDPLRDSGLWTLQLMKLHPSGCSLIQSVQTKQTKGNKANKNISMVDIVVK